ncbi:MAG: hypothetical protein WC076_11470 [Terrimicrobiaceae bacterium]|jgi:hypothetical protein|nr:hypothetical protein [Terrimicrobiaceae bacterium]
MNGHKKAQDAQKERVERCEALIRKVKWQDFEKMLRSAYFVPFWCASTANQTNELKSVHHAN